MVRAAWIFGFGVALTVGAIMLLLASGTEKARNDKLGCWMFPAGLLALSAGSAMLYQALAVG